MGGPGSGKPAGYGRMKGQSGATKKTSTSNSKKNSKKIAQSSSKKKGQSSSENTWKGSFRNLSNGDAEWQGTREGKNLRKLLDSGKITESEYSQKYGSSFKKYMQNKPLSKSDFDNMVYERSINPKKEKMFEVSDSEWDYIGKIADESLDIVSKALARHDYDAAKDISIQDALMDRSYNKYLKGYVKNGKNGKKKK